MLTELRRRLGRYLRKRDTLSAVSRLLLRVLCVYKRGMANALDLKINKIDIYFQDLPGPFEGYRILHLSDLHIDGQDGLTEVLIERLRLIDADLALFTGDFHLRSAKNDYDECFRRMSLIVPEIRTQDGIFAIRGNHDLVKSVPNLAALGIKFLNNRAFPISCGAAELWLVGLDDPCHYITADLDEAFREVPEKAFKILLVHTPKRVREAAVRGVNLYLCGHTHGGQVLLPILGPPFLNTLAPRRFCCGLWKMGKMWGYTTLGVGGSSVPVRIGCRPEIALITLRKIAST